VAGSVTLSSLTLSKTAFNTLAYFALRPRLFYDEVADVKPDSLTNPGQTVTFDVINDLAPISSTLTETNDVTIVSMSDAQVSVTLGEYANAVTTTALARAFDYIPVNPLVANVLGFNAGLSQDTIARNAVQAGTNVIYQGGVAGRTSIAAGTNLTGSTIMQAVANLRTNNVQEFDDGQYRAIIHPLVSYDLRRSTGAGGWNDVHVYSAPQGIFNGTIGTFGGVTFMEAPRAPWFVDASNGAGSTGTVDVYGTLVLGRQAIVKAYTSAGGYNAGATPTYGDVPVVDAAERFTGKYWKWCGGYAVFRQAAIYRVEAASSIGAN
jgi:N4-gp56 family major capsid protein